ncbi:MFS transporter [Rhodococcus sp. NCIMB 12038]|uniref:MFS transporter n=1 Tax=Rhodococcus sp. NCIMB 12038 TaxID=933800 RepID=UPI0015C690D9|nr:MFS transporter [Rhodococcus sp. NCIMB 12038]
MTEQRSSPTTSGTTASTGDDGGARTGVAALVLLAACTALAQGLARYSFGPLLLPMREDVIRSYAIGGLLATVHMAGYLVGAVAGVRASARVAPLWLIRTGMAGSVAGLAVLSFSTGSAMVGAGLFLTGMGGALVWLAAPAVAVQVYPCDPGRAIAIIASSMGIGITLGSVVPALVPAVGGWRAVWGIEAVSVLVVLCVSLLLLGSRPQVSARAEESGGWRPDRRWIWTVVAFAAFSFGIGTGMTFFVAALRDGAGWTVRRAGATYSMIGVAMIAGGVIAERLSRSLGRMPVLVAQFVLAAASMFMVATGMGPVVSVAAVIIGTTMSGTAAVVSADLHDRYSPQQMAAAFGLMLIPLGIGQMLGPTAGGWAVDLAGDPFTAFMLCGAVMGAGLLPLVIHGCRRTRRAQTPLITGR